MCGSIEYDNEYFEYVNASAVATDLMFTDINTETDGIIRFASAASYPAVAGTLLVFKLKVKKQNGVVNLNLYEVLDSSDNDVTNIIHTHSATEWVVVREPTCTETGLKQLVCTDCQEAIQSEELPMVPHTQGDWIVSAEPTCTEAGEKVAYCTVCGNVAAREAIPPLYHKNSKWVTVKSATYSEEGLQGLLCNDCGQMLKWQTIPMLTQTPNENGLGDVDQDGNITIADYTLLKLYLSGRLTLTDEEFSLADINNDGTVDAFDILYLNGKINNVVFSIDNNSENSPETPYDFNDELPGFRSVNGNIYYLDSNGVPIKGHQLINGIRYYFNDYGAKASKTGIDVSKYQGNIDWQKVKAAGVDYAIIRLGFTGYGTGTSIQDKARIDNYFEKNLSGAKAAGIDVGVYYFSQAISAEEAVYEASLVVNNLKGRGLQYPVYFDTEFSSSPNRDGRADGLSKQTRTQCAIAFCETVKKAGYRAGVYASKSFFENQLIFSNISQYEIWVAHYTSEVTTFSPYRMWQYTSSGTINGISGRVNVNISLYDYKNSDDMLDLGADDVLNFN